MMGERAVLQEALLYSFNLDRHVPMDHLLRSIDRFVDLSGVRERHLAVHLRCRQHIEGAVALAQSRGLIASQPGARAVAVASPPPHTA